jgi:hypothetical protein
MTKRRRDKLDDDRAREWLEKHAPTRALKPKPKLQRRERWQRPDLNPENQMS